MSSPLVSPPQPSFNLARRAQQGVVLLMALIALVALSLAGIGFMRAVDTSAILAGNLAFNRAAVAISDAGMEEARTQVAVLGNATTSGTCSLGGSASCLWMNGADMTGARAPTGGTPPIGGYFAWADPTFDYRNAANWTNAYAFNNASAAWTAGQQAALVGYDIRYIIHRMCEQAWLSGSPTQTGDPRISNCLVELSTGGQSKGNITVANNQTLGLPVVPVYRITIRVTGPRSGATYVQLWMR